MKSITMGLVLAVGMAAAGTATAGEEALAEKSGCLMCHAVETKKIGPSFKHAANEFKGLSETDALARWKKQKPHAIVKASDDEVKTVLKWVMTLK
jgi:cytochrome c